MALNWDTGAGHVLAGGKSLEWAAFGQRKDNAPVIVLLHEGLGCVALWRDFPQTLATATGLPVFAYSRAGYGQSDAATLPRPLDYMTREALDVLPEILDAVGADKVILMGHSDGATIAAEYAGRVQDFRVRGLVLMAPHFFAEEMGLAEIGHILSCGRDGTFCTGFNPKISLERSQTIMQGASHCDFRYELPGPTPVELDTSRTGAGE